MEDSPPAYSTVVTEDIDVDISSATDPVDPSHVIHRAYPSHVTHRSTPQAENFGWCSFTTFMMCLLGGAGGAMFGGIALINTAAELTEETCVLTHAVEQTCTYSCGSDNESTCSGTNYDYEATAVSKCGEFKTLSMIDPSECPMDYIGEVGTVFTCHVLDCEDSKFNVKGPNHYGTVGAILVTVACILLLVFGCVSVKISKMFC